MRKIGIFVLAIAALIKAVEPLNVDEMQTHDWAIAVCTIGASLVFREFCERRQFEKMKKQQDALFQMENEREADVPQHDATEQAVSDSSDGAAELAREVANFTVSFDAEFFERPIRLVTLDKQAKQIRRPVAPPISDASLVDFSDFKFAHTSKRRNFFDASILAGRYNGKDTIFPNGCMERYLRTTGKVAGNKPFPFRPISADDVKTADDYAAYLGLAEQIQDPFRYLYLGLYTLFEPSEYISVGLFDVTERGKYMAHKKPFSGSSWSKLVENDPAVFQWMTAMYILGELAIPVNVASTSNEMRHIIEKVYGQCGILSPWLLLNAGSLLLKTIERLQDGNALRDARMLKDLVPFASANRMERLVNYVNDRIVQDNPRDYILGSVLEMVREEQREVGVMAMISFIRTVANENLFDFRVLGNTKLLSKSLPTHTYNVQIWPALATFGRMFMYAGEVELRKEEMGENKALLEYLNRQNQAWTVGGNDRLLDKIDIRRYDKATREEFSPTNLPGAIRVE